MVRREITERIQSIAHTPQKELDKKTARIIPATWGNECKFLLQEAYEVIDMVNEETTRNVWTLFDCQEYIVDLEMKLARAMAALEVAGLGQFREDRMSTRARLEGEAGKSRELALRLRRLHLETSDGPSATSMPARQKGNLTRPG